MDTVTLAARYLPAPQSNLPIRNYLIVKVGLFGPPGSRLKLSPDHFTLRINGKGRAIDAQLPGIVAGSFPAPDQPLDLQKQQDDAIERRLSAASLPEGESTLPRSGLLYFPYKGDLKKVHSLVLLYDGPLGKSTLILIP
jgi:hypothetical protein